MSDNRIQQKALQRSCPNCGAALRYNPQSGKLRCEHCKSEIDFEKSTDVEERDFSELFDGIKWDESKVGYYRCKNCGASAVLPRTTLATTCPYCSSPIVLDEREIGLIRPDSVVPFEITEEQAEYQLRLWKKRKIYAPNPFRKNKKENHTIKGVYAPVWTFDFDTTSYYSGRLGKTCTRTVRRNGKTYTESYVKWFNVDGIFDKVFDDIYVSGSDHFPTSRFESLGLKRQSKYVVYGDEYLQGYMADNYSVEPEEAYRQAMDKARSDIYRSIMAMYNADHDGGLDIDTKLLSRSFKYILLPVYVATSKYKNKVFNQYISGTFADEAQTKAKVCGKAPVSPWKVLITVLVGLGLVAGIIAAVILTSDNWSFDFGDWDFKFKNILQLLPVSR